MPFAPVPPATPRETYHHGNLRQALLDAALESIGAGGVDKFSLREAARTLGVSASAAYRHFPDKDALLDALAQQGFAELAGLMEAGAGSEALKQPRERAAHARLEAIGLAYVQFAAQHPARFKIMFGAATAADARARRGVGSSGLDPYQLLARGLDELLEWNQITPQARQGAETVLWAAVHGLAGLVIDGLVPRGSDQELRAISHQVIQTVLRGLTRASE